MDILILRKGCVRHVSKRRKLLDAGRVRGGVGCWNPDRGNLSGGRAAVSGGLFADRVRLRLLQTLRKGHCNEYCGLEISQGTAGYFAQTFQSPGISPAGGSYSRAEHEQPERKGARWNWN